MASRGSVLWFLSLHFQWPGSKPSPGILFMSWGAACQTLPPTLQPQDHSPRLENRITWGPAGALAPSWAAGPFASVPGHPPSICSFLCLCLASLHACCSPSRLYWLLLLLGAFSSLWFL